MKWCSGIVAVVFGALSSIGFAQNPEPIKEPALAKEIKERVARDQAARMEMIAAMNPPKNSDAAKDKENKGVDRNRTPEKGKNGDQDNLSWLKNAVRQHFDRNRVFETVAKMDRENTAWLKEVVSKHGWPGRSLVGAEAAGGAWLLVQHADADPAFQRKCLDLMEALPAGEIKPDNLALLTDRVLLAEGKKQRYGTQFENKAGKWVPRPLEDPDQVDARRAKVGLGTLKDYAKKIEEVYGPKKE